jgi:hypothetical protein
LKSFSNVDYLQVAGDGTLEGIAAAARRAVNDSEDSQGAPRS